MRSIEDCLGRMTINGLRCAAFRVHFNGEEAAGGKRELAAALAAHLRKEPNVLLPCIPVNAVGTLHRLLRAQPARQEEYILRIVTVNRDRELGDAMWTLKVLGLAWRDVHCWHIQPEVRRAVAVTRRDREFLEFHESVYRLTEGALRLYGIQPLGRLAEAFRRERDPKTQEATEALRNMVFACYASRTGPDWFFLDDRGEPWLVGDDVMDAQALWETIEKPGAPDWAPYALVDFEQAMVTGTPNDKAAIDATARLSMLTGVDELIEAVPYILYVYQEDGADAALQEIRGLCAGEYGQPDPSWEQTARIWLEHLPIWSAKGHTLSSLRKLRKASVPKVRFRDPCPCGSGLPYGKCHGRMN